MDRKWNKKRISIVFAMILVLSIFTAIMPASGGEKNDFIKTESQIFALDMPILSSITDRFKQIASTSSEDFIGVWVNTNPEAKGMIGFIITKEDSKYYFHGYGACHPNPCDWGTTELSLYSTSVSDPNDIAGVAEYDFGFKETKIFLLMLHPRVILAFDFNKFKDESGRHNYFAMNYFIKL
ncbi:MAG: hypothetical protein ACXQTS_00670 [Candidatus Methanospirareceae archaeon]